MNKPLKFLVWFPIVIVAVFVVAWLWIREASVPGPYDMEPVSIVRNGNGVNSTSNDVAGWQTYRNEKYGFEFKYPSNVLPQIKEYKEPAVLRISIKFDWNNVPFLGFEIWKNDPRVEFYDYFTYSLPHSLQATEISGPTMLVSKDINGIHGIEAFGIRMEGNSFSDVFVFKRGNFIWSIELNPFYEKRADIKDYDLDLSKAGQSIYNQILSTFKFIN